MTINISYTKINKDVLASLYKSMGKHFQNKFKPYFPSTQINNIVTQKKSVPSIYFPLEKSPQETLAQRLRSRGRIELPNFPVSPRLSRALYTHPKCPENGSDCFQCGAMTAYFTRGNNVSPSYIYTRIYTYALMHSVGARRTGVVNCVVAIVIARGGRAF